MIFQGQTHLIFQHKKKEKKLASKVKEKCGRRAWPNGLVLCVKRHLIKERKRIDFETENSTPFPTTEKE